jgi:MFS family permease
LVQITGINAIVYYSPTIIQEVGVTSPTGAIVATGFVQVASVIAEIVAFLVVDRWGRRPTLLTGIGTMAVANAILVLALVSFAFVHALAPETRGRPLEAIRTYWYNGGRWPEETST